MKNINKKTFPKIVALHAITLILLTCITFVAAEDTSISTGTFNVTNSKVRSIQIFEADTTNVPKHLVPQQSYDIIVNTIFDTSLASVDSLEVKMWLDVLGNQTKESHFNDIKHVDGRISARIKWIKEDNAVILDTGEDTTWSLLSENCVLPNESELTDDTIKEFEFIFRVMIGKVARMTEGDSHWMLAYQTMSESGTFYDYYAVDDKPGLKMDWYCEVESPTGIDWGNIMPGISYEEETSKQRVTGVRYISNGKYNEQVKFDADWKGVEEKTVAQLTSDALNKNEFALKVNNNDNLQSSKQIPSDGSFVITSENNEPTNYEGVTRDDYYFYIKLNENFDMGMYTGNITFGISNGL